MPEITENNTFRWTLTLIGLFGFFAAFVAVVVDLVQAGLPAVVWVGLVVFSVWGIVIRAVIEGKTARQRERDAQDYELEKWGYFGDGGWGPAGSFSRRPKEVYWQMAHVAQYQ